MIVLERKHYVQVYFLHVVVVAHRRVEYRKYCLGYELYRMYRVRLWDANAKGAWCGFMTQRVAFCNIYIIHTRYSA
jgi:hypothetical protein